MSEIRIFTIGIEVHERPDHAEAKALRDIAATPGGLGSGPPQPRRPRPLRVGEAIARVPAMDRTQSTYSASSRAGSRSSRRT